MAFVALSEMAVVALARESIAFACLQSKASINKNAARASARRDAVLSVCGE